MQAKAIHLIALCLLSTSLAASHHHRRLAEENGFNSNFALNSNTAAGGAVQGYGNARVQLAANNKGSEVAAVATDGAIAKTNFMQNMQASQVNNGFNVQKDKYGNVLASNGFNDNSAQIMNTASGTQAFFGGNGALQTGAGVVGIHGTAIGTNGAGVAGEHRQDEKSSRDTNGFNINNKRLLFDKKIKDKKSYSKSKSRSYEDNNGWNLSLIHI